MTDLKHTLIQVISERAPWEPNNKEDQDRYDAEADASAHALGNLLNKSLADLRDIDDGTDTKLRKTAKAHSRMGMTSFKRYRELGGEKSMDDLAKPFAPRKEWEAAHKAQWMRDHPKPKDDFGNRNAS